MVKAFKGLLKRTNISVGEFTYGHEGITYNWCEGAKISIGKYCSIASNVIIQCGGNHRIDWISTFPFGYDSVTSMQISPVKGHPKNPRDVIIGNDVWIGNNVTLMGGTVIEDGAVIGMNSHVYGLVPAYSVFSGNPAKLVKYRFEAEIITLLRELQWWKFSHEKVLSVANKLCNQPTRESIKEIRAHLI